MLLSILICHLTNRGLLLKRLMDCLQPQVDRANARESLSPIPDPVVEILVEADSGQRSTGEKRNALLARARSEYACYVDDDDVVSDRFVDLILKALESKPDCVSLEGIMYRDGFSPRRFSHSLRNGPEWRQDPKTLVYLRGPNHLNTVRRELALQAGFDKITIGEDKLYATRLFPLLKTESVVDDILYQYFS